MKTKTIKRLKNQTVVNNLKQSNANTFMAIDPAPVDSLGLDIMPGGAMITPTPKDVINVRPSISPDYLPPTNPIDPIISEVDITPNGGIIINPDKTPIKTIGLGTPPVDALGLDTKAATENQTLTPTVDKNKRLFSIIALVIIVVAAIYFLSKGKK